MQPFCLLMIFLLLTYLNSKLDFNLSCAVDFRNLNYILTWCINERRLLALIIFQRSSLNQFPIIKRLAIALMYCNILHVGWSTQSRSATLLSSLIARGWDGLNTLWQFRLKDYEMVGAWCFGCLLGPPGLPVGFLMLRYSVLFTAESLSLFYLLFISWFICSRRWCIDKLGVFYAHQTSMCLDPHLN